MDALKAALANGADAVYLGAAAYGARAGAGFDEEALRQALRFAHLHRRKIYVTVNILVKERELKDVRSTLSLLSSLGADAVLVQDLGVMKICREEYPDLPVHASTQMALHNAFGARMVKELGASRAVMARECSLPALRAAARTGIEIEAFCHGALCVSCSGQCLFSSMIGGRSGNRGRCAQPCRLPYVCRGETGAWLSPRDLCARNELKQMAEAGVYSFKIEGRLKRPEYVAVVTRAYRRALDAVLEGRFAPADEAEMESLTQIFSRGGFTPGYPGNSQDADVVDPGRVKPAGVPLGAVRRVYRRSDALLADVPLRKTLHNGDGLELDGQTLRYSGPETPAGQTAVLRLREAVKPGAIVLRTEDERQLAAARATYADGQADRALPIPFDAVLTAWPGKPLSLTVTDGESAAAAAGEICQAARQKPLDEEAARRSLEKTGGTPFALKSLTVRSSGAFVPASALNALRRDALNSLTEARIAACPRTPSLPRRFGAPLLSVPAPRLLVRTQDRKEMADLLRSGADEVLLLPPDFRDAALIPALEAVRRLPAGKARLCLPGQMTQETQRRLAELCRSYGVAVCLSSPNQLTGFDRGDMAGEGVPVMNGEAARMLAYLGCRSVTLSRELAEKEAADLPRDECELILPVYGRARLMLLNHCPMRTRLGLRAGRASCELCAQGKGAAGACLTDRMGAEYPLFPIRMPEGCEIELMADKPLHLSGRLAGMRDLSWLLTLTDEAPDLRLAVTAHYAALLRGETPPALSVRGTWGRFLEGVL